VARDERSDVEAGAALLKALASPLRLAIVLELQHEPRCVHELVEALRASQPLVSQNLRTLREAQVIVGTRRGREIEYHLTDHHVLHVVQDAIAHALEPKEPGEDP
jgi:ArsR family transcriptional regulator